MSILDVLNLSSNLFYILIKKTFIILILFLENHKIVFILIIILIIKHKFYV